MSTNKGFTREPEPDYNLSALNRHAYLYYEDHQTGARVSPSLELHLLKSPDRNDGVHHPEIIYEGNKESHTTSDIYRNEFHQKDEPWQRQHNGFIKAFPYASARGYQFGNEPKSKQLSSHTRHQDALRTTAFDYDSNERNKYISTKIKRPRQVVDSDHNSGDTVMTRDNDQQPSIRHNENRRRNASNDSAIHTHGDPSPGFGAEHFPPANFYCRLICDHPTLSFFITLGLHIAMVILTGILLLAGYNITPVEFRDVPLVLYYEDVYLQQMAWNGRAESKLLYDRTLVNQNISERSVRHPSVGVTFIYEAKHGNIFTKENLQIIKDFEDKIYQDKQYMKNCVLLDSGACEKPHSLMRFFDGTYYALNPVFNDSTFTNIGAVVAAANSEPLTQRQFQYFLGIDTVMEGSENVAITRFTRTALNFGIPILGFNTTKDPDLVQLIYIEDFILNTYTDHWQSLHSDGLSGLRFTYGSRRLEGREMNGWVMRDMMLITGSSMFIFIFMWIQTSSLWLTSWGIGSIMLSLVTGNLIYNIVFDFKYLGIFHMMAMFILLGIGADDIFIFCETWKAQKGKYYPSLAHRLTAAYRKSAGTMLVTSITTAAAFFTSSFSPILTLSSFGTFAGLIVLVNYLSAIIFYPTVIIIWHLNWEHKPFLFAHCLSKLLPKREVQTADTNVPTRPSMRANQHRVVRFLSRTYFHFITHNIVRGIIVVAAMALVCTFIYFLFGIEVDDGQYALLKVGNNLQDFRNHLSNDFLEGQDTYFTKQYVVWGLKNQNMSECHPRNYDLFCKGQTVWDNGFDLNQPRGQKALMDFCLRLLNMSDEETTRYKIKRNIKTNMPEVDCFILSMDEFFQKEAVTLYGNVSKSDESDGCHTNLDLRLPLTQEKMQSFLKSRPDLYHPLHTNLFYRYFETAVSYWLANGYRNSTNDDSITFKPLIGESFSSWDTTDIINKPGIKYGTRLKYVAISINLTINFLNTKYNEGLDAYRLWETFIEDEIAKLPPPLQNGFHTTAYDWHWFHVSEMIVRQSVISVAAGLSIGWVLLVIISGNVIIGTMAAISIACVTTCVAGLIPVLGWKLGALEAVNLSLVVGLSVDYVVHLGVAYTYAPVPDRKGRVQHALREIGLSVIAGAITTLGSGFFMFFAQIVLFMQFGIFIFATIGFSMVLAMTVFLAVLSLIGPQGKTGMTGPIVKRIIGKLRGKSIDDERCTRCFGKGYVRSEGRNFATRTQ